MLKIATVCSGIGSPEMALSNLGIEHEIVFATEIDKYARKSYLANFETYMILEDMTKEDWVGDEYYADLFVGGIPCQSFSLAGKRLGESDPRGLLFYDFYRYVKNQSPKFFIIENVKGLLSDNDGETFRNWIQLLGQSENGSPFMFPHEESLMYNLHWQVLNTKDYGLPQNRERVFLVGIRNDMLNDFNFPKTIPLKKRLKDVLEYEVDEKYYLSDKMIDFFNQHSDKSKLKGNGFAFRPKNNEEIADCITARCFKMGIDDNYIKEPQILVKRRTEYGRMIRSEYENGIIKAKRNEVSKLEPRNDGINNTISTVQKDNLVIEPFTLEDHINNKEGLTLYGNSQDQKISPLNGCCQTISSGHFNQPKVFIDYRIRRLTPLECFRLQGYSDDFFYKAQAVNSGTQLYKQAGNTISVPVIQAILKNLLKLNTK